MIAAATRIPCTVCRGAGTCMVCDDDGMVPTRHALAREVLDRHSQYLGAQEIDARQGNAAHEGFASDVPIYEATERFLEFVDPDGETGIDFEDVEAVVALAKRVIGEVR